MVIHLSQFLNRTRVNSALREVDADEKQVILYDNRSAEDISNEIIIPAVLTALSKYSLTAKGAEEILLAVVSIDWPALIFGNAKNEIAALIATYLDQTKEEVAIKIKAVTDEAIRSIRKKVTANGSIKEVRDILADSLDDALFCIPIQIQITEMIKENITNARLAGMETPASELIRDKVYGKNDEINDIRFILQD